MSRISRSHNKASPAAPRKETTASNDASARPPQHKSSNESLKKLPRRHQVSKSLRMTAVEQETLYTLPSRDRSQEALSAMPPTVNEDAMDCSLVEVSHLSLPANPSPRDTMVLSVFRHLSGEGMMGKESIGDQTAFLGSHFNTQDTMFWEFVGYASLSQSPGHQMREGVILNNPGADGVGQAVETAETYEQGLLKWARKESSSADEEWVLVQRFGEN